jgi:hypothetical protein
MFIGYILGFFIIIFLQEFFLYYPSHIHVYIQIFNHHINISVIYNIVYIAKN